MTFRNERIFTRINDGLHLWLRPALLDASVVTEVLERDSYRLRSLNLKGATVIDAGAHVGVTSTCCAQLGAVEVYAVEPELENLELLRLNAQPWPQITVIPKALGAVPGVARMAGESGGAHADGNHPDAQAPVEQTTLAALMDEHIGSSSVGLLKLDMEGGEVDALLGCDHAHLSRIARIVLETHGPGICPWVERPRVGEVVEHLQWTHNCEVIGFPSGLGMIFGDRNGCDHGWPT